MIGYKMFRRDRSKHDGGIVLYINENIPLKTISVEGLPNDCRTLSLNYVLKAGNGFVLVSTSLLHKMKNISLKIFQLLWLRCLVNMKILF